MKTNRFILLFTVFLSTQLIAATSQYTLSLRDNPSNSIVIGWSGDNGTVYYGTTDYSTNYASYPNSQVTDRTASAHGITRRFVRLSGLLPKTTYYFVIRDANNQVSARFKFITLSDNPMDPVTFISGGDTRDGFKIFGQYVEDCPSGSCLEQKRKGNRLVAKLRPDFVAFNGDFVMNQVTSNTMNEWNEWLNDWQLTNAADGRMFPMTFTQGNHEDNQDMYNLFDVPVEEYYSLSINNGLIQLYLLNSELNACSNTAQLNWFSNDLMNHTGTANDPYWKFVQYHIPTFAMGNSYGLVSDQMTCWVSLFEQYGVKLVTESHTHITKWTYPCVANSGGNDFQTDANGIVYIGEGQWGAPHRTLDFTGANQKSYIRNQDVFDNFFYIRVTPVQATIQTIPFDGNENVAASASDEMGKVLPNGVATWNPSNGNTVVLQNPGAGVPTINTVKASISPNPAQKVIEIKSSVSLADAKLELYNGLGKMVKKEEIKSNGTYTLNIEDLAPGQGQLVIKYKNGRIETIRFVKN
jgi:uncharacterized membrane protein